MSVAGTVVGEDPLLRRGLHLFQARLHGARPLRIVHAGHGRRGLQDVERRPRITSGDGDEVLSRIVRQCHCSSEAAFVGHGPVHDGADLLVAERLQAEDAQPREERRVHLEIGVLRGRPDERDGAVLDLR